jgi:hypothetical protein
MLFFAAMSEHATIAPIADHVEESGPRKEPLNRLHVHAVARILVEDVGRAGRPIEHVRVNSPQELGDDRIELLAFPKDGQAERPLFVRMSAASISQVSIQGPM